VGQNVALHLGEHHEPPGDLDAHLLPDPNVVHGAYLAQAHRDGASTTSIRSRAAIRAWATVVCGSIASPLCKTLTLAPVLTRTRADACSFWMRTAPVSFSSARIKRPIVSPWRN